MPRPKQTHCQRGHELRRSPSGKPWCSICIAERKAVSRALERARRGLGLHPTWITRGLSIKERIAASSEVAPSGCWEWTLQRSKGGYGRADWRGTSSNLAHRIAYEAWRGEIPAGLHLDHLCRNRCCVNPEHLEAVTGAENTRRGARLITHCPQGHEYTPENTIRTAAKPNTRLCRQCNREHRARSHRRAAQERNLQSLAEQGERQ